MRYLCLIAAFGVAIAGGLAADFSLANFISARDDKLFDGTNEFRFISFNIPNLLEIEDNVAFTNENPWRLPNTFEINDALETVRETGGTVARTYVISVQRTNDAAETPRYVLAPDKFNEQAFRVMDEVLATANRTGIRLIIPLVDNWPWMGGRAEYAGFRGKTKDEFWTDPQLITDFERTIHFILTRTNTLSGVRYSDDKSILCWETGNELSSPPTWTREIARYIKSLDANHLVMDGFNTSVLRQESLEIPEIDIVTTHHYPGKANSFVKSIQENAARAKGKKAYVVGEFGFISTEQMAAAMTSISDSGASGGLLWSLRFRNRDGGFYWHSEPFGNNLYKAFHWPASHLGDPYDEEKLLTMVRSNAFGIRKLSLAEIPIPAAPKLLPITDVAQISWQGSVGAKSYEVERSPNPSGEWRVIATNVDEALTQYRPQFTDESVPAGKWFYRIRARNDSGASEPSNVIGPVSVQTETLVDEFANLSKVNSTQGTWKLATTDCRAAKEDAHRAAGRAGDQLTYKLPTGVASIRAFVFFPKTEGDLMFSISDDGKTFRKIAVQKMDYFHGAGEYGYWKPVVFYADAIPPGKLLKLEITSETQIGRLEISHKAAAQ